MQPPTTIHNHPQPSTTTQKLHKKTKTFDVNTETDIVIDNDIKQWYLYTCVYIYILYKTYLPFFRYTDFLVLSTFEVIHLMLRAMSDIALKTFTLSFFMLSFLLMSGGYKRSNLQQKACMTFCYFPTL